VHVAEFLHDVLGPGLSAVGLQLDLLRMDYGRDGILASRLSEIQTAVDDLMTQVRCYSNSLRIVRKGDSSDGEKA
jgi:hypothetical protein